MFATTHHRSVTMRRFSLRVCIHGGSAGLACVALRTACLHSNTHEVKNTLCYFLFFRKRTVERQLTIFALACEEETHVEWQRLTL